MRDRKSTIVCHYGGERASRHRGRAWTPYREVSPKYHPATPPGGQGATHRVRAGCQFWGAVGTIDPHSKTLPQDFRFFAPNPLPTCVQSSCVMWMRSDGECVRTGGWSGTVWGNSCPCSRKNGKIAAEAAQKWGVVELWASNGAPRTLSAKRRAVLSVTMCACDTGVCGGRQQRAQAGGPHTKRQATRGAACACA